VFVPRPRETTGSFAARHARTIACTCSCVVTSATPCGIDWRRELS
jgi:hypothetical protein